MGKIERPKISEAVSVIAHQLKNPISALKNYLEVLISEDFGKLNKKQREYLSDALENVRRMSEVTAHLLDVYLIEQKMYKLKIKEFPLEKTVGDVIKDFSAWAKASNCKISFKKEKRLPKALSDPIRIRQVIENLISNAIKYKNPGLGKIEIGLRKRGKNLLFSLKDTGVGIPKEDFEKVFTKFYRSEKAMELDPSGIGLGLFINKATIELSGGKIWFEKNKNSGMTFYFTLPILNGKKTKNIDD